jgi:hypothetical protein
MKVLDPGHSYELHQLDGDGVERLTFVKRCNPPEKFPGNVNAYSGTTSQEVIRALIDRAQYVHRQIPHDSNIFTIDVLREAMLSLELRAAERHGRHLTPSMVRADIENEPTCSECRHILHECQKREKNEAAAANLSRDVRD